MVDILKAIFAKIIEGAYKEGSKYNSKNQGGDDE
jgi:hypothetical protein